MKVIDLCGYNLKNFHCYRKYGLWRYNISLGMLTNQPDFFPFFFSFTNITSSFTSLYLTYASPLCFLCFIFMALTVLMSQIFSFAYYYICCYHMLISWVFLIPLQFLNSMHHNLSFLTQYSIHIIYPILNIPKFTLQFSLLSVPYFYTVLYPHLTQTLL